MTVDPVRAIADAVLYEGYILWPYRRSALKNQRRFTFGGVHPPAHCAAHPDDPALMRAEVLVQGPAGARVDVAVRFLQVVRRTVHDHGAPVDELVVDGDRLLSWGEAVEREMRLPALRLDRLVAGTVEPLAVGAGAHAEHLDGGAALVRSWRALDGCLRRRATPLGEELWRVALEVENTTAGAVGDGDRERALEWTLCSTHALLHVDAAAFVSSTDPPPELAGAAAACHNVGVWPVLVGDPGDRTRMLAAPIILEDHPRIAPESPGDLFDGGEIDQLLILNILALTDEEKAEMAATDARAREILERTESLTPDQMMRLHGLVRG